MPLTCAIGQRKSTACDLKEREETAGYDRRGNENEDSCRTRLGALTVFFSGYCRSHRLLSHQLEDQFCQLDHQLPPQSGERRELEDEEEGGL